MAALGQPVEAASAPAPAYQQPYQGVYQDLYAAAQEYGVPQYTQSPGYPGYSERAFQPEAPLAGALQWEMPQVCCSKHLKYTSPGDRDKLPIVLLHHLTRPFSGLVAI